MDHLFRDLPLAYQDNLHGDLACRDLAPVI
jgi:hypothetical protein